MHAAAWNPRDTSLGCRPWLMLSSARSLCDLSYTGGNPVYFAGMRWLALGSAVDHIKMKGVVRFRSCGSAKVLVESLVWYES